MPVERATRANPLIRAVENLAIQIVLALVGRAVAPADWRRAAVAFQLGIVALIWHRLALDVIHDSRLTTPFEGIQHPTEERTSFVVETDPSEGIDGEGRIANPCISVVPVPLAADGCRQ